MRIPRQRRILALDAGFRHLGICVWNSTLKSVEHTECFSTAKDSSRLVVLDNSACVAKSAARLRTIIGRFNPSVVIAELPVGASKSQKAASAMGMALATVVSVCSALQVPLKVVMPKQIKRLVSPNSGRASVPKEKVIAYVIRRYGPSVLPVRNADKEHVADAIVALEVFLRSQDEPA